MWEHRFIAGSKPDGTPILSVLAKRTYTLKYGTVEIAEEQQPLLDNDVFAHPEQMHYSEVLAEMDLVAYKPSTDVIVTGKAHAPLGKQAYQLDCSVTIGPYSKKVMVYGKRKIESRALRGLSISKPQPFTVMELGYRYAFGGTATSKDGTLYSYYPNPIGCGFSLKGGIEPEEITVPNLEDPDAPLSEEDILLSKPEEWVDAAKPASFGWTRRNFYPRYTYAGVLPDQLQAAAGYIKEQHPESDVTIPRMDYRFYQGASDGLWGKSLSGNEHVKLVYFDPKHPTFEFTLPGEVPEMSIDTGDGPLQVAVDLQTVTIDMEKKLLSMVWRGFRDYEGPEQLTSLKKEFYNVR